MSEQQGTTATTVAAMSPDELRARIIDAAVRESRERGWCGEFETIMGRVFPEGPPNGDTDWYDSDGFTCRGYDRDGRDASGFNREGYDRDGYGTGGYNREGFNREGYDRYGFNAEGFNRDGLDREGFNRDGVNADGLNRNDPEYQARYRFNARGFTGPIQYDLRGRDPWGESAERNARMGYDLFIYDENRHNAAGVDYEGYSTEGTYVGPPHVRR